MSSMSYCPNCDDITQHVNCPNTETLQCKGCGEYHELQTVPASQRYGATHAEEELDNDRLIDSAAEILSCLQECVQQLTDWNCGNDPDTPEMIRAKKLIVRVLQ